MPGDSVNEVYPLSQLRPITPHPSNVRQERKRQRKKDGKKEKRKKNAPHKDRVSLGKGHSDKQTLPKKPAKGPPKNEKKKRGIDIKI